MKPPSGSPAFRCLRQAGWIVETDMDDLVPAAQPRRAGFVRASENKNPQTVFPVVGCLLAYPAIIRLPHHARPLPSRKVHMQQHPLPVLPAIILVLRFPNLMTSVPSHTSI
jgi:hypothetical protein